MSDPTPDEGLSVTWRTRHIRRAAGTLGAAVVLATIGPAIANAAGADVANPIAAALRASGKTLVSAFDADENAPCVTPTDDATTDPATEPTTDPSTEPSTDPSTEPDETVSAEPTDAPDAGEAPGEGEPAEYEVECDDEDSESPSPSPTETSESPSPEPTEEAEEGNHGQIVSTVAHCAPRGKDPLLDVEGTPGNHGGYVKVAAHGDTLTLPWGSYDLSTQAGADDLCASLEAARADLEDEDGAKKDKKDKKDKKEKKDKSGRAGKGGNR